MLKLKRKLSFRGHVYSVVTFILKQFPQIYSITTYLAIDIGQIGGKVKLC